LNYISLGRSRVSLVCLPIDAMHPIGGSYSDRNCTSDSAPSEARNGDPIGSHRASRKHVKLSYIIRKLRRRSFDGGKPWGFPNRRNLRPAGTLTSWLDPLLAICLPLRPQPQTPGFVSPEPRPPSFVYAKIQYQVPIQVLGNYVKLK
jgi:hypothetical protein